MSQWVVDVPGSAVPEGPWVTVATFETREEAVEYVHDTFGGDDEGRVNLITEVQNDTVEDDGEEDDDEEMEVL